MTEGRIFHLPTGNRATRVIDGEGTVTFTLLGRTLTALDAMALGRLAEEALRGLTLPHEFQTWESGHSISEELGALKVFRAAVDQHFGPESPLSNRTGRPHHPDPDHSPENPCGYCKHFPCCCYRPPTEGGS